MSRQQGPDFEQLIGAEVPAHERERLRKAHSLLVQAGAPPELSPDLEKVPWPDEALQPLGLMRRRAERRRPVLQIAIAAAAILAVGYLLGSAFSSKSSNAFDVVHVVKMHGIGSASAARASIAVGKRGEDGNWPMLVTVTNLAPAQDGGYYDLWLSRGGRPQAFCGSFNTKNVGDTIVRLSAAYQFKTERFDGWIVTRHVAGEPESETPVVMTT